MKHTITVFFILFFVNLAMGQNSSDVASTREVELAKAELCECSLEGAHNLGLWSGYASHGKGSVEVKRLVTCTQQAAELLAAHRFTVFGDDRALVAFNSQKKKGPDGFWGEQTQKSWDILQQVVGGSLVDTLIEFRAQLCEGFVPTRPSAQTVSRMTPFVWGSDTVDGKFGYWITYGPGGEKFFPVLPLNEVHQIFGGGKSANYAVREKGGSVKFFSFIPETSAKLLLTASESAIKRFSPAGGPAPEWTPEARQGADSIKAAEKLGTWFQDSIPQRGYSSEPSTTFLGNRGGNWYPQIGIGSTSPSLVGPSQRPASTEGSSASPSALSGVAGDISFSETVVKQPQPWDMSIDDIGEYMSRADKRKERDSLRKARIIAALQRQLHRGEWRGDSLTPKNFLTVNAEGRYLNLPWASQNRDSFPGVSSPRLSNVSVAYDHRVDSSLLGFTTRVQFSQTYGGVPIRYGQSTVLVAIGPKVFTPNTRASLEIMRGKVLTISPTVQYQFWYEWEQGHSIQDNALGVVRGRDSLRKEGFTGVKLVVDQLTEGRLGGRSHFAFTALGGTLPIAWGEVYHLFSLSSKLSVGPNFWAQDSDRSKFGIYIGARAEATLGKLCAYANLGVEPHRFFTNYEKQRPQGFVALGVSLNVQK